jgi:ATP-dependent DNA helicase RecG
MPQAEYQRLLLERIHASARWENQPGPLASADVDADELLRTVDDGVARGRLSDPGTREPDELLRRLGLMTEDRRLMNAAAVLFGSRAALATPYCQCVLRMARFRGVEKQQASDDRQVVANAFELLRLGEQFLLDHLPIASRFSTGQFTRIDQPLYPPDALREALANALCHRDYSAGAGSTDIAIYDDRLEIVSVGCLHFGLRPEDLYECHPSRPWNPIIASMFHRRGIIEQWGMGTLKIVSLAESAGLARPEFEERAGSLVVRFLPTPSASSSTVDHDLSGLQRDLLAALSQVDEASLSQILVAMSATVPARTAQENLSLLRGLGLVDSTGRGRGARWRLRR